MELLRFVRDPRVDQVTVRLKNGKIVGVDTEGEVAPDDVHHVGDAVGVRKTDEFESITLHRRGADVRARRKRPKRFTHDENERHLFGGTLFTGETAENDDEK